MICEYRRWIEWMERYADENPDKAGEREYLKQMKGEGQDEGKDKDCPDRNE